MKAANAMKAAAARVNQTLAGAGGAGPEAAGAPDRPEPGNAMALGKEAYLRLLIGGSARPV